MGNKIGKPAKNLFRRHTPEKWEGTYASTNSKQLKGVKGGNCNISACQAPGAHYYNHSVRAYYCKHCAIDLNRVNRDWQEEYGHPLCTIDPDFAELLEEKG